MIPKSSILYENPSATAFVVDIPSSIALAQVLPGQTSPPPPLSDTYASASSNLGKSILLSSAPPREPYPPSTEPKSEAARARVLERIPLAERHFHSDIEPLVAEKLSELQEAFQVGLDWCLPRILTASDAPDGPGNAAHDEQIQPGKRKRSAWQSSDSTCPEWTVGQGSSSDWTESDSALSDIGNPPLILSPGANAFESMSELSNAVVKNTSSEPATVQIRCQSRTDHLGSNPDDEQISEQERSYHYHSFYVPPLSHFLRCRIPISESITQVDPIPGLSSEQKFNLILLDPPWTNRSVRRSGHYQTQSYLGWELLTRRLCDILQVYLREDSISSADASERGDTGEHLQNDAQSSMAAIWITNSAKARKAAYDAMQGAGLVVYEEWVWLKTTTDGRPISALGGLWRKPYEILVIGKRVQHATQTGDGKGAITRRVVAAVPDVHSRKPNLKELFERMFFSSPAGDRMPYSALEVFARNLTAGWWACGDDVLKFNSEEWWVDDDK